MSFPVSPDDFDKIINTAYNGSSEESENSLQILSELLKEPFILDFVIEVLKKKRQLSDNTIFYCLSAARKFLNYNRDNIENCIDFFTNLYKDALSLFSTEATLNESIDLFNILFRSNENYGVYIINQIMPLSNDISLYYATSLLSSNTHCQKCIEIISSFISSYLNKEECQPSAQNENDHLNELIHETFIFARIVSTFKNCYIHPIIISTIIQSGGIEKLFEITTKIRTNIDAVNSLLSCISKFCVLDSCCFSSEGEKQKFILQIADSMPKLLEYEFQIKNIYSIVDIYLNLSRNRLYRVYMDHELFENWISSFFQLTNDLLNIDIFINENSLLENILELWINVSNFDMIRKNEDDRNNLYDCIEKINAQVFSFIFPNAKCILELTNEDPSSNFLEKFSELLSFSYQDNISLLISQADSHQSDISSLSFILITEIIKEREISLDRNEYIDSDIAIFHSLVGFIHYNVDNSIIFTPHVSEAISLNFHALMGVFLKNSKNKNRTHFIEENCESITFILSYLLSILTIESIPYKLLRKIVDCFSFYSYPPTVIESLINNESFLEQLLNWDSFPFLWDENYSSECSFFTDNIFYLGFSNIEMKIIPKLFETIHLNMSNPMKQKRCIHFLKSCFISKKETSISFLAIFIDNFFPIIMSMAENNAFIKDICSLLVHLTSIIRSSKLFNAFSAESFLFYQNITKLLDIILVSDESPLIRGRLCSIFLNLLQMKAFNIGILIEFGETYLLDIINKFFDIVNTDLSVFETDQFYKKYWDLTLFILDEETEIGEFFGKQAINTLMNSTPLYLNNISSQSKQDIQLLFQALEASLRSKYFEVDNESVIREIIISCLHLFATKKIQQLNYWSVLGLLIHSVEDSWFSLFSQICGSEDIFDQFSEIYSSFNIDKAAFYQITITKILNAVIQNIISFLNSADLVSTFIGT